MTEPRILVVDDQQDIAKGVAMALGKLTSDITVVHSGEDAIEALRKEPADLMLTDIKMPGISGVELLGRVQESWPGTSVVLFTGYGTIESAVESMRLGAVDYLVKPFEREELLRVVRRALKDMEMQAELAELRAELSDRDCFEGIHSRDRRMRAIFETIERVAPSDAAVLIQGESGTGKELVARAVHAQSGRGPFVAFNAGAVSEQLAEAELFGAKKGAYTGSDQDRKGLFLEADGGTLFIDEIGSMPLSLQSKVLRTLQEGEILPVGASVPVKVDVRVISACNRDPMRLVQQELLRADLYYRLSVVPIALPPLRDRVEDVVVLSRFFLERRADKAGETPQRLMPRALRLLVSHNWPGNVRELQNVIERAALMSDSQEIGPLSIVFEDEPGHAGSEEEELAYEEAKRRVLEQFQRRYVERLLEQTGGNVTAAARKAKLTRAALHRILNRLGMTVREKHGLPVTD